METFFQASLACHSYEAIRDRDHLADAKAFIEQLWSIYSSYADPGFLEDAKTHFHQKVYTKCREKGLIGPEDGYIIAINGWETTGYRPDFSFPLAIKAAIGIGHLVVSVDPTQQTPSRWYHQERAQVFKKSGSPVATTAFLSAEYEGVLPHLLLDR